MDINDHDHETPYCAVCVERIGMMTDARLMLRGQFFYDAQNGYAMFILDPDTKVGFVELPDALGPGQPQYALIVNKDDVDPIVPIHEACVEDIATLDEDEDEDEESLDELEEELVDDLDLQMRRAMERDEVGWDDHDLLTITPRR